VLFLIALGCKYIEFILKQEASGCFRRSNLLFSK